MAKDSEDTAAQEKQEGSRASSAGDQVSQALDAVSRSEVIVDMRVHLTATGLVFSGD